MGRRAYTGFGDPVGTRAGQARPGFEASRAEEVGDTYSVLSVGVG
jgi:hypothetical protein